MSGDLAEKLNALPKFVASSTLNYLAWNAEVLDGDAIEAIARLKASGEKNRSSSTETAHSAVSSWRPACSMSCTSASRHSARRRSRCVHVAVRTMRCVVGAIAKIMTALGSSAFSH